jgi:DNA polymerase III delta subunit
VFELANAVLDKNIRRAVEIAERMFDAGESSVPMIAVLTQQFMKLWKLPDALRKYSNNFEIAKAAGIAPHVLPQYQRMLQKYSLLQIENAFAVLARADEQIKTSQGDDKIILAVAISEIIMNKAAS